MQQPSELHLPWPDWRPGQRLAIRTGLGKKKRHIVIQAPTGAGKSAIAGALCQIDARRTCILTATNGLTRQYEDSLPWLAIIRGAGNYSCDAATGELARYFRLLRDRGRHVKCDDGPCRSGVQCSLKEQGCSYYDAYRHAKTQRTVLTNYAYFFAIHRFGQGLMPFERIVLDEAHDVADQLMKASAVELARHHLRGRKIPRTVKGWVDLAGLLLAELPVEGSERDDERVRIRKLREQLKQLTLMDATWAWDGRPDVIEFQPTIPRLLLPKLLPNFANVSCVWLSATVTPATMALLGIDPDDIDFHVMPSRFDIARRPIYVVKCVRVDSRMSDIERDYWIKTMDRIIATRTHLRGIIHTVSYARAEDIMRRSKYRDLMVTHAPGLHNLDRALKYFRTSREPRIMVSPALTTGYDFKGDDARWQIVAKLPFPDTRSAIMKARASATLRYTDNLTMQTIVQTCGRINREDTDWGETFIVDNHADWFLKKNNDLAPRSFLDALQWVGHVPPPLVVT